MPSSVLNQFLKFLLLAQEKAAVVNTALLGFKNKASRCMPKYLLHLYPANFSFIYNFYLVLIFSAIRGQSGAESNIPLLLI
jgi:hypothetical protein